MSSQLPRQPSPFPRSRWPGTHWNLLMLCQVSGVLLVAPSASLLESRRKEFSKSMKEVLQLKQEQRATSQAIAYSLDQVKVGVGGRLTLN